VTEKQNLGGCRLQARRRGRPSGVQRGKHFIDVMVAKRVLVPDGSHGFSSTVAKPLVVLNVGDVFARLRAGLLVI
jgi:hypothetical protein